MPTQVALAVNAAVWLAFSRAVDRSGSSAFSGAASETRFSAWTSLNHAIRDKPLEALNHEKEIGRKDKREKRAPLVSAVVLPVNSSLIFLERASSGAQTSAEAFLLSLRKSLSQHGCSAAIMTESREENRKSGDWLQRQARRYSSGTHWLWMTDTSKDNSPMLHKSCDLFCSLADLLIRDTTLTYSVKKSIFLQAPAVAYRYTSTAAAHTAVILLHVRLNQQNKQRLKFKLLLGNIQNRVKLILFL